MHKIFSIHFCPVPLLLIACTRRQRRCTPGHESALDNPLLGDTLVTLGTALITANFLVLTLALLHKLLQNSIIVLGDGLGRHLHGQVTTGSLDLSIDSLDSGLKLLDTKVLVETLAGQDVQRRGHKLDLDLVLGCVLGLGGAQGVLDGDDTLVAEAGNLDIGTDLGRGGGELLADVLLQLLLDGLAGEVDLIPDLGVTKKRQELAIVSGLTGGMSTTYEMEILNASWE